MAIRYSATLDAAAISYASGAVYAELLAGASQAISVHAIRLVTTTALGGNVGLVRSFAIGTGAATGIATGITHRTFAGTAPNGSGMARLQAAWSQSPTGWVSRLRDEVLPNATGTFRDLWRSDVDGPLVIEPAQSLLLINQGSGISPASLKVSVTWEEGPAANR